VRHAVKAAYAAGAQGVVLSRKYLGDELGQPRTGEARDYSKPAWYEGGPKYALTPLLPARRHLTPGLD
jgi:hypothetical protein